MPNVRSMKSCTCTVSGSPFGRSSRPAFLNDPTSSFFLVSTEMTGWPDARCCAVRALMCLNCALRSGCWLPSRCLLLACKLYPSECNIRLTTLQLTEWPLTPSSCDNRRTLLSVQRSGDSGSPRVAGSTSDSRSESNRGSRSTFFLRPPPGRRTRRLAPSGVCASGARNSRTPLPIVERGPCP